MINYLELENWKAHGLTRLEFSKGTNVLVGQMGAGKSSILDAISFALFGTFPAVKNRRVKVEDLIRNKPVQKRSAHVKLGFDVDGTNYTVERTISLDGTAKATFKRNEEYVQSQPQRVTEEIEKALKVDYDLFARAIYAEQNRLDYFLELGASDRKKQIDNLLGLDRFAAAQENAGSLINRIKETVSDAEKTAKGFDIEKLKEQHTSLVKELEQLEKGKKETEAAVSVVKISKDAMEKQLASMKALYDKKIRLEKEAAESRSKITVLEKEISSAQSKKPGSLEDVQKQMRESEARLSKLKKELSANSDLLQSLQGNIGKLSKELSDLEKSKKEKVDMEEKAKGKNLDSMKAQVESESKALEALDKEYAHSSAMKQDAEKSVTELRKHIAKCPVCDSELSEEKKRLLIASKSSAVKEAEARIKELTGSRSEKKDKISGLNSDINNLTVLQEKLKTYGEIGALHSKASSELAKSSAELTKAKDAFNKINDQLSRENESLSELRSSKETAERLQKHLAERQQHSLLLESKAKELSTIDVSDEKLEAIQKQFTTTSSALAERNAQALAASNAIKEKQVQVKDKSEEIARIDAIYKGLGARRAAVDDLSRFRNALMETQAALRSRLISSINGIMQEIWPVMYPYGDYTGITLSSSESDYALQLRIIRDGEYTWENVNAIASGGERTIACMAMRIAFSLVLVPNLKWLILDEPTHNIDQEGLAKFVSLLNETLPRIIGQIFIITHDDQLKRVANGRIYAFTRNKAKNGETVVQEI